MSDLPISAGDLIVAAILLTSGLLAFVLGFVWEVLWAAAWVGAFVIAYVGYPHVAPLLSPHLPDPRLADIAAGVIVFLVAIVVLSMITRAISRLVRGSGLNALDRSLGFVFGLVRGAVIVVLLYIGIDFVWKAENQPDWIRDARSLPLVESGADYLRSLISSERIEKGTAAARKAADDVRNAVETERKFRQLISPQPKSGDGGAAPNSDGYGAKERSDMDRLIDSTQGRQ